MSTAPRLRSYPKPLGDWIAHAMRLSRLLDGLSEAAQSSDPSFVWLLGRGDEVRLFVREVIHDWSAKRLAVPRASGVIAAYLAEIHVGLRFWRGEGYVAPCCGVPPLVHRHRLESETTAPGAL
jgi:hypothetical protein